MLNILNKSLCADGEVLNHHIIFYIFILCFSGTTKINSCMHRMVQTTFRPRNIVPVLYAFFAIKYIVTSHKMLLTNILCGLYFVIFEKFMHVTEDIIDTDHIL